MISFNLKRCTPFLNLIFKFDDPEAVVNFFFASLSYFDMNLSTFVWVLVGISKVYLSVHHLSLLAKRNAYLYST